jgi:hypothetical protein
MELFMMANVFECGDEKGIVRWMEEQRQYV